MSVLNKKIAFLGAGEIASALMSNMIKSDIVDSGDVMAYDIVPERLRRVVEEYGAHSAASNAEALASADYAFACVRSEYAPGLAEELRGVEAGGKVIVSISSGVPMRLYESTLEGIAVARALPNPPSKIGAGAIAVAFNGLCSDAQRNDIFALFSKMGKCFELEENKIDAVTAITCLAPLLSLCQASVEAAVLLGVDLATSQELVMQTIRGGLAVWEEKPRGLAEILDKSATPGGVTARMLYCLDKTAFKYAVKSCVEEGALLSRDFGAKISEKIK